METLYYIILVPMVYLAFAVFLIGTTVRLIKIFREPKHPSTLQIFPEKRPGWLWALFDTFLFPTVRRHKPVLWFFFDRVSHRYFTADHRASRVFR